MAGDVVSLIKHVGFSSIDILGFSMGGMIVQQLLVREGGLPFKVKHVVLTATSAKRAHSDLLKAIPQGGGGAAGNGGEMSRDEKKKLVEPFTYVRSFASAFLRSLSLTRRVLLGQLLARVYQKPKGEKIRKSLDSFFCRFLTDVSFARRSTEPRTS